MKLIEIKQFFILNLILDIKIKIKIIIKINIKIHICHKYHNKQFLEIYDIKYIHIFDFESKHNTNYLNYLKLIENLILQTKIKRKYE